MTILVTFCDRSGDHVVDTILMDAEPRTGETVHILIDGVLTTRKVESVSHAVFYEQEAETRSRVSSNSRFYVMLDFDIVCSPSPSI